MQDIKERKDEDLLVLPTDGVLFEDPSFKVIRVFLKAPKQKKSLNLSYLSKEC